MNFDMNEILRENDREYIKEAARCMYDSLVKRLRRICCITTVQSAVQDWSGMSSQVERGTIRNMVHAIAFRAGVLERILQEPAYGSLEVRTDELAHVQLLQRQIDDLRRYLSLPSAERKTGRWIPVESPTVNGRCSVCGYESHLYENDVYGEHFCPSCGAEMRGER